MTKLKMSLLLVLWSLACFGYLFAGQIYPPPAIAKLCLNRVVPESEMQRAADIIQAQGCPEPTFVRVDDGHFLAYGVKVLIGEGK